MSAVHDKNRSCFSSEGCVNGSAVVTSLLNEPFYGRRFGAYDGNYPVGGDHISVTDAYKFHILLNILDLLTYLLDLRFHINDDLGDIEILSL